MIFLTVIFGLLLSFAGISALARNRQEAKNDLEFKNQEWKRMCARLENVERELSESKRHELAWRHQYAAANKELEKVKMSVRIAKWRD